jgi:hypothetical protein
MRHEENPDEGHGSSTPSAGRIGPPGGRARAGGPEIAECQDMRQEAVLLERAADIKSTMTRLWLGAGKAEVAYYF